MYALDKAQFGLSPPSEGLAGESGQPKAALSLVLAGYLEIFSIGSEHGIAQFCEPTHWFEN